MTQKEIEKLEIGFVMPDGIAESDRSKLENAAGSCPIKASFRPEVDVSVQFFYE